jgi:hypothetical protein
MRGGIWIVGLAIVLMGSCLPALAQDKEQRVAKSRWPFAAGSGSVEVRSPVTAADSALWRNGIVDLAVRDTLVYCLQGGMCGDSCASMLILNISDPAHPRFLSRIRFHGGAVSGWDMKLYGDYGYLIIEAPDYRFWLYLVDVSNPASPFIAGRYRLPPFANYVDVLDNTAYVTHGGPDYGDSVNAILVLDVRDPASISQVGWIPTDSGLYSMVVRDDYSFATNFYTIYALDITDPLQGRVVGKVSTGYHPGRFDFVSGDSMVYVADRDVIWPESYSAFTVLNVADPEHPAIVSQYPVFGSVLDVKAQGHWGFLSNGSCGLQIIDVSDPANPDIIARFQLPSSSSAYSFAGQIAIYDTILVFADVGPYVFDMEGLSCYPWYNPDGPHPGDLTILGISDPANPNLLGYYSPPDEDPTGVDDVETELLPTTFALYQNYPNPFNPGTVIEFDLPTRSDVQLTVYNLLGQEVTQLVQSRSAGHHTIQLNMRDQASGVYFYELRAGDYSGTGKMLLLK